MPSISNISLEHGFVMEFSKYNKKFESKMKQWDGGTKSVDVMEIEFWTI